MRLGPWANSRQARGVDVTNNAYACIHYLSVIPWQTDMARLLQGVRDCKAWSIVNNPYSASRSWNSCSSASTRAPPPWFGFYNSNFHAKNWDFLQSTRTLIETIFILSLSYYAEVPSSFDYPRFYGKLNFHKPFLFFFFFIAPWHPACMGEMSLERRGLI